MLGIKPTILFFDFRRKNSTNIEESIKIPDTQKPSQITLQVEIALICLPSRNKKGRRSNILHNHKPDSRQIVLTQILILCSLLLNSIR